MVQCQESLPIQIEINKSLEPKHFSLPVSPPDQHFAIPFRIYFEMVNCAISQISEAYKNRVELENAVEVFLTHSSSVKSELMRKVRRGELSLESAIPSDSKANNIREVFESEGIPIIDNEHEPLWEDVWASCVGANWNGSKARSIWDDFLVKIGSKSIRARSEFSEYIRALNSNAAFLVMALSGMRIGELLEYLPCMVLRIILK